MDIDKFIKDGWAIVDLPDPMPVKRLIQKLHELTTHDLSRVHLFRDFDATRKLHIALSEYVWDCEWSLEVGESLLPLVRQFIGLDVMVQYYPYFRIARPNARLDNIGYHKDTQYGQTPYELAVHIPFVDLDEKSALRVISGSHLLPERDFVPVTPDGGLIEKGSIENRTGRPYLPRVLIVPKEMETTPLVMKVGQCAIFSPAIFHGQEVNEGDITRVSCDLRFVSAKAPFEMRQGKTHAGYVPISQSPVEKIAELYYGAQK